MTQPEERSWPEASAARSSTFFSKYYEYILVAISFIILTIIFTWPIALNFTTSANGNIQDIFHEVWFLRLGSTAPYGPFFLFFTNTILYPTGVPLYFQVASPFNTLIFALFAPLFGEIAAYNFLYMLTFFLSGLFMYVFANYLTKNQYAAFVAGVIFAFAPIHLAQGLGHLNIMSAEFIPLFGYYLIRLVRESSARTMNAIYLAIAVILNAMCDLHMLLMVATITVAFLIYYFLFETRVIFNISFMSRFILAYVIAAFFTFIIYFQTVYGLIFAKQAEVAATAPFNNHYSADLVAFFIPPPANPILGHYTIYAYAHLLGNPLSIVYIGWTAIGLAVIGTVAFRKNREVLFWLFVAIAGFLISLGPYLTINGQVTPIPGVWQWFYFLVPLFKSFRTPYRFAYTIMLGVAVLAAYGVTWIGGEIHKREKSILTANILKTGLALILVTLIVIECITIPFPTTSLVIPPGYQILAKDHSNYAVLEVPSNATLSEYLYYQSAYNRPLVNGHVSRTPQYSISFLQTTPFINQLGARFPGHAPPDIINQSSVTAQVIAPYILSQYNIKYIIVHKNLLTTSQYTSIYNFVSSVVGSPIYQDSLITIFEYNVTRTFGGIMQFVTNDPHLTDYSLLYGAWYQYGSFHTPGTRSIETEAGLQTFSKFAQSASLTFTARGITGNYSIEVIVNGKLIGTYPIIRTAFTTYTTPGFVLTQGENTVEFYSTNGCSGIPVLNRDNIPVAGIPCVSVGFSSIELV